MKDFKVDFDLNHTFLFKFLSQDRNAHDLSPQPLLTSQHRAQHLTVHSQVKPEPAKFQLSLRAAAAKPGTS